MIEPLTEQQLAEWERQAGEATPGPWFHDPESLYACVTSQPGGMD